MVRAASSADDSEPGKHEPAVVAVGSTNGQLKVAVAVWIEPVATSVASAIIVAPPVPYAVTIPALAPPLGLPVPLVFTGKTLGADVSHVTEFVRSLTEGGVEYEPMARNCPWSRRLPTVIEAGTMVSESRGSGAGVKVTLTVADDETREPSGLDSMAVMVLAP
jgi:hypothetical protein